jgi:hypothetical protein
MEVGFFNRMDMRMAWTAVIFMAFSPASKGLGPLRPKLNIRKKMLPVKKEKLPMLFQPESPFRISILNLS